jgi:putative phage-type endonuclease
MSCTVPPKNRDMKDVSVQPLAPLLERLSRAGVPDDDLCMVAGVVRGIPVQRGAVSEWLEALRRRREKLSLLLLAPGIPQRTPEWYARRETLVTASDLQTLLDVGAETYCRRKAESAGAWDALSKQPAIRWGRKYEPVAAEVYSRRTGTSVHEFGLLIHPDLPGFGASPDGITCDGVMLEIKCPYSRRLDGTVPRAYYAQIQGQLDTAGLDECDYFECRFGEYHGASDFLDDGPEGDRLTVEGLEKGAMFRPSGSEDWEVCSGAPDAKAAVEWALARSAADPLGVVTFWHLLQCDTIRIRRDPAFMEGARGPVGECHRILSAARDARLVQGSDVANPHQETRRVSTAPALPSYAFLDVE